jgi:hypothetical protein
VSSEKDSKVFWIYTSLYQTTNIGIIVDQGKRVGYNNMIYDETEIERIARVAGKTLFSVIELHDLLYRVDAWETHSYHRPAELL